jgi:hypothetical protein
MRQPLHAPHYNSLKPNLSSRETRSTREAKGLKQITTLDLDRMIASTNSFNSAVYVHLYPQDLLIGDDHRLVEHCSKISTSLTKCNGTAQLYEIK